MCIRDRHAGDRSPPPGAAIRGHGAVVPAAHRPGPAAPVPCLLYTSDAADERSSVDLGGRRIIKKKENEREKEKKKKASIYVQANSSVR